MRFASRSDAAGSARRAARLLAWAISIVVMALPALAPGQSREALGEGDSVRITVFQNPDLTTDARVSQRGTISFPLVGEVTVAGLTPAAAEARIARLLEDGRFVLKPQVSLNVTRVRSRQVTVLGQVARPGRYPLEDPTSGVTDLIALAGGIVPGGDENVIVVTSRDGRTQREEVNVEGIVRRGDVSAELQLGNGDTIYVQRAPVFYIYGEVSRAGAYRLEPAMTVMQAIALGGGITPRGTERGLKIRRRGSDGSFQTIEASLTDTLRANDVVYVNESLF